MIGIETIYTKYIENKTKENDLKQICKFIFFYSITRIEIRNNVSRYQ